MKNKLKEIPSFSSEEEENFSVRGRIHRQDSVRNFAFKSVNLPIVFCPRYGVGSTDQRKDLMLVLHRPVELTPHWSRSSCFQDIGIAAT